MCLTVSRERQQVLQVVVRSAAGLLNTLLHQDYRDYQDFIVSPLISMDPLSIAAASASLAGTTLKLSKTLWDYVQSVIEVDFTVRMFQKEVVCLAECLNAISKTFKHPAIAIAIADGQAEYEGALWTNLDNLLSSCRVTISQLEKILVPLKQIRGGIMRRPLMHLKLSWKSTETSLLQRQIQSYCQLLSVTLSSINLYELLSLLLQPWFCWITVPPDMPTANI